MQSNTIQWPACSFVLFPIPLHTVSVIHNVCTELNDFRSYYYLIFFTLYLMQWTIYTDNPHVISCDWQKTWDCGNASDLRPSRSSQQHLQISFLNNLNFCAGNHLKLKLGHMSCLLHQACVELALWAFCFAPRLDSCALSIVNNVNLCASYT